MTTKCSQAASVLALCAGALAISPALADVTVISFGGAVQKAQQKAYYEPLDKSGL